ncbi:D-alanyl-D-alanine carboxypeptidase family protein [Methylobacillus sp. MM3]|uniref:D-alanyl-D-alanine carboxypeptidase family protein n=1 Tax=Methylobacillus sp. MM3 TaxID=1848039 RepID=UPI000B496817|nr:D-alanyl-D-alanine carboxypeptidase family protein [Methylobacillus sp. MM3]
MRLLLLPLLFLSSIAFALDDIPPPPTLAAKAYLLLDFNSRAVLAQQNANERVDPASLTKLMTAYLSFKALKNGHLQLEQTLPVSVKAWKGGGAGCGGGAGSCMFIEPNKPVTVDQLLHGMIVISGNDASVALAEGIASSEEAFADLMNKEAARLGMKGTHFVNSTGLPDPNHYTTASDLAILAAALVRDYPEQYKRLYSLKDYTFNNIKQANRNRLLWVDPFVDGMKTGHTSSAGYCLVSSAKRGDMRLISILLGAPSDTARAVESQKLLNYGFQFFESRLIYKRGQAVSKLKVWKGRDDTLAATVADDLYVTLPKNQLARMRASVASKQPLIAPVAARQEIGAIRFSLDGKQILERPLVASQEMPVAGIFGRLWDSLKLMLQ